MSAIPADYKYSSEHEWVSPAVDGVVTLGITDHAQAELGDVVYVDLPPWATPSARTTALPPWSP